MVGNMGAGTAKRTQPTVVAFYRKLFSEVRPILDVGCGIGEFLWSGVFGVDLDFRALTGLERVVQADLAAGLPFTAGRLRAF